MSWWKKASIAVAAGTACFVGGYFTGYGCKPNQVVIKWKTKTEVKYKVKWYKEVCGPLEITGKQTGLLFDVHAEDNCVKGDRRLIVDCPYKERKLTIMLIPNIMAGYNSGSGKADILTGLDIPIVKNYGLFSIGGAAKFTISPLTKDWYAGAGAAFGFNP